MFTARHDFDAIRENRGDTRFSTSRAFKHTPTTAESVDQRQHIFSENPSGPYLSSLENRDQLNQVLSKPKMNSLQGTSPFGEDVFNTPVGSSSLRSISGQPVSTLSQRGRPFDEDVFNTPVGSSSLRSGSGQPMSTLSQRGRPFDEDVFNTPVGSSSLRSISGQPMSTLSQRGRPFDEDVLNTPVGSSSLRSISGQPMSTLSQRGRPFDEDVFNTPVGSSSLRSISGQPVSTLSQRGRPFDEDVLNTPVGSSSLRSISGQPVSTLPQRDPLEEDEFHNFGRNPSDTERQCQSLGCIQPNPIDVGSRRRPQSYFVKHPEGKSCNGNLNIENEQLIERSKDGEDIPISCSSINKSSDNTQPCYTTATAAIKPKKHFFSVFGVNKCQKSSKPPQGSEHDTNNSSSNRAAKGMFSKTRTKFDTCDICNQPYTHGLSSTLLSLTK